MLRAAFCEKACQRLPYGLRTSYNEQLGAEPKSLFLLALPTGFEPVY